MNHKLTNAISIIAKIFEICFWVFGGITLVATIVFISFSNFFETVIQSALEKGLITISGFDPSILTSNGTFNIIALILLLIMGIAVMAICAMICRNISLIFKSEKPFTKDNIKRVRDIGIYAIAIPIAKIIITIIISIIEPGNMNFTIDVTSIFFGLVVLGLSQFFKYGTSMENDIEGLL